MGQGREEGKGLEKEGRRPLCSLCLGLASLLPSFPFSMLHPGKQAVGGHATTMAWQQAGTRRAATYCQHEQQARMQSWRDAGRACCGISPCLPRLRWRTCLISLSLYTTYSAAALHSWANPPTTAWARQAGRQNMSRREENTLPPVVMGQKTPTCLPSQTTRQVFLT